MATQQRQARREIKARVIVTEVSVKGQAGQTEPGMSSPGLERDSKLPPMLSLSLHPFFSEKRDASSMKWRRMCWQLYDSSVITRSPLLPLLARPKAFSSVGGSCGDPTALMVFLLFLNNIVIILGMNESFTKQTILNIMSRIYIQ